MNLDVLPCYAIRRRNVIWWGNQNSKAQVSKRKYKLFCKLLTMVCCYETH